MGIQLRQWAVRLLAAAALPIMLTLGLGAAANAQPVLASHATSSTALPSTHRDWAVYGPYHSLGACLRAKREFRHRDSHCGIRFIHRRLYEPVWYLYVQPRRM